MFVLYKGTFNKHIKIIIIYTFLITSSMKFILQDNVYVFVFLMKISRYCNPLLLTIYLLIVSLTIFEFADFADHLLG